MEYRGKLIYRERMRRGWSQEGLCKGICAVSYLSKIENGKADASGEILRLLLNRLELPASEAIEAEAAKLAEAAYELLFSGRSDAFHAGMEGKPSEKYRASSAGLDFLLLEQFAGEHSPLDAELESCMDERQLALQRILQQRHADAIRLLPNAFCHLRAGMHAYNAGDYASALEYLQAGYNLAAAEGAPQLMLMCKVFIGNLHSARLDVEHMLQHYAIAKRLASALGEDEIIRQMDYNIASTQMENGEFEEAFRYFSGLEAPGMLSLHKLAICCEKTGRAREALAALDRAASMESEYPDTPLARQCCDVVRYRLEHADYLDHAEYGRLLLDCFEQLKRQMPMGYAAFHLPWVLEWFRASRQYKRALDLMLDFPGYCGLR